MIKLVTSFFLIIFLVSCKIQQTDQILDILPDKETIKIDPAAYDELAEKIIL